jgi:ABC-2 type transport system ATP-binding protein
VGIAQALLGSPGLVLLDEPTSGMDPIGIKEVREILLDLQRNGTTIFINSHLLSEIERICDRIAIINNGKIIADGNKQELSIQTKYLEITGEYLTDKIIFEINKLSKQKAQLQDGSMKIYPQHEDDALTIHQIIATLGGRIHSLNWVSESLEDIFYRLIKHEDK